MENELTRGKMKKVYHSGALEQPFIDLYPLIPKSN